jgi:hypothetical protein
MPHGIVGSGQVCDTLEGGCEVPLYVTRRYCCIRIVQHGTPPDTLARLASTILLLTMLKEHLELTLQYQVGVVQEGLHVELQSVAIV